MRDALWGDLKRVGIYLEAIGRDVAARRDAVSAPIDWEARGDPPERWLSHA